jgi:hypothetical protein
MKTILVCAMVFLGGCTVLREPQPIRAPMPEIAAPDIPLLKEMTPEDLKAFRALPEATQQMLIENDNRLKLSVRQQKASIDTYNSFAREQNKKNAAVLGLPVPKEPAK